MSPQIPGIGSNMSRVWCESGKVPQTVITNKESNSGLPLPHRRPPSGKSRSCYRHQPPFAAIEEISESPRMHVQNVTGAG